MKNNNIEQNMKSAADGQVIAPPPFVWDNIEKTLHPKKSKKGLFFLLFGFSLIAGSLIAAKFYINNNPILDLNQTNSETIVVESKETESLTTNLPIDSVNETNKDRIATSSLSIDNLNQIKAPITIVQNSIPVVLETKKTSTSYSPQKNYVSINNDENLTLNNATKVSIGVKDPELKITRNNIHLLSKIKTTSLLPFTISPYGLKNDITCPSFNNKKKLNPFASVSFFGGRHTKSLGDGNNTELASLRNSTESAWYSWGFRGAAGINFNSNIYAGLGIDWTQSKEKFYDESKAITKMIITFDPNSGAPIDTSFVTGRLVNKGEIKYTNIDIPLFVGLTKNINQWNFGIEAGPYLNVSFAAKGKIYSESLMVSRIEQEPSIYKTKLGLGIKANLVVRRYLNNGISIEFKPAFKTYLGNINDVAYPLPTKLSTWGLNIGIRKDF